MLAQFDLKKFSVKKFDAILARGLSHGMGSPDGQMCIEAAICNVMGLPHGDDPGCVVASVRWFKLALNDQKWSSPEARATGLRDLGLAQLGSNGTVDDGQFVALMVNKLVRVLVPTLIRDIWPEDAELLAAADLCEKEQARQQAACAAVLIARIEAGRRSQSSSPTLLAAFMVPSGDTAASAIGHAEAAYRAAKSKASDKYLCLGARCALEVLIELKSPGVALLKKRTRK